MAKSPHDRLFRRTFSDPENARGALRALLPAAVGEALEWSELEVISGASYVDSSLGERELDLLYRVPIEGAPEPALLYLLFEHQSTVDHQMPARMLVYLGRVLDRWLRDHPRARQIPVLIPMVLHHSRSGWTAPTRLLDLVAVPEALRAAIAPHVPDVTFLLDDLSRATEAELYGRALAPPGRLALWALRFGRDTAKGADALDLAARLTLEVFAAPSGLGALEAVFSYLAEVRDDDFLDALAQQTHDQRIESYAMSYKQQLIDKGLQKGLQKGREEGREEGREDSRRMLSNLLRLKFGGIDPGTERRLEGASRTQLVAWADQVLDADSLADVFDDDTTG